MQLPDSIINLLNVQMPFEEENCYNGCHVSDFRDVIQGNWYRHGLESLALALFAAGVSEEIIKDAMLTALDAYANNC